jgi:redox-sensitive bicupin YhaK (pirin superfamily)
MAKAMVVRRLKQVIIGNKVMDGDGVQLTRVIGSRSLMMLDPFLLFDVFGTDKPQDSIGGFPSHPHRGFETVSYLLDGAIRHKDNAGNEGVLEAGGVQWMTAGSGIVHSEMPEQHHGLLQGFQLWVNLPADSKMTAPAYQEFSAEQIPVEQMNAGGTIKVIAGKTNVGTVGPVINDYVRPTYLDVALPADQTFEQAVEHGDNAFIYVISGSVSLPGPRKDDVIETHQLGILDMGERIQLKANKDSRFLLVSATPLNEPVVRGGPFVMNTQAQLEQAFADFGR